MTKTLSFGAMHLTVAFVVVYLLTGDWLTGGLVALVEPCINTVAFHLHEKLWARAGAPAAGQAMLCGAH
ncbi:MAG TPA: DUF2061 domain-containing protein [Fontimonas sp.]